MNYLVIANSPRFFEFLLILDLSIAQNLSKRGCDSCGKKLHWSNWFRKGFGIPNGCSKEVLVRHSFQCCNCRSRHTPNSLRWMYYQRYSSCLLLLAAALQGRGKKEANEDLCKIFKISKRTLSRWRNWWKEVFEKTAFWKIHCVGFGFMKADDLANAILRHFEKQSMCLYLALERSLIFLSRYRTLRFWMVSPPDLIGCGLNL